MALPTVLIAHMGLDAGGAETHAVVLCKCLKDMGYNVVVASNGGIYEKELVDYGIKHYRVSLNTKRPWQVVQSFLKLIKVIRQEKVQLIHAHARIPAFICNIVSKLLKVKFITTAHAKFRSNLFLKLISVWGEKTIAVSEDIKTHLVNKFGVSSENITIISNGIDTNNFTSGIDYNEILNELNIDGTYKKIVWVSRIDSELAKTISSLIEASEDLSKEHQKLAVIIVGSGDNLDQIKRKADEMNAKLDKKVIHVLGQRTDINKLVNCADVFVGISRAALEAMACEKPVVLAGPWSFVGTMDESNLDTLISDNFTGRNFNTQVTCELLYKSIKNVIEMNEVEREKLCKFERNLVVENYSAEKMAKDTAEVYDNIIIKGEN